MEKCKIETCKNNLWAKGFCNKHYQRFRLYGDPAVVKTKTRGTCHVDKCDGAHKALGFCSKHYMKMKRTGTLDKLLHGKEWRRKQSESHLSDLSRLDPTPDPKYRGFLAVNVVNDIKYKAIKRGKVWKLNHIDVYKMIIGECHYCGYKPSWPKERVGLDRIDNKKGYLNGNVVGCCFTCNSAKGVMGSAAFHDWAKRLAKNMASKKHTAPNCRHPDIYPWAEAWCDLCRESNFK